MQSSTNFKDKEMYLMRNFSPTTAESIKRLSKSIGHKGPTAEQMQALDRMIELKQYVSKMYCKNEVFSTAIDYEGKKITWKDISELISS